MIAIKNGSWATTSVVVQIVYVKVSNWTMVERFKNVLDRKSPSVAGIHETG
jgi:hypothetical protein